MGANVSKEWQYGTVTFASSVFVHFIVYVSIMRKRIALHPFERMEFASTILSSINAIIMASSGPLAICHGKLWETPVVSDYPNFHIIFGAYMQFSAYLMVDLCGDIVCYCYYKNTKHAFDFRKIIMIHHFVGMFIMPLLQIPEPKYYWFVLAILSFHEFSTLFLNLKYFAQHFKASKKFRAVSKLLFAASWFFSRVPGVILMILWFIKYWDSIMATPKTKKICVIILAVCNILFQSGWTAMLIQKIISYFMNTETTNILHDTAIQFGSTKKMTTKTKPFG
eukprot:337567_1